MTDYNNDYKTASVDGLHLTAQANKINIENIAIDLKRQDKKNGEMERKIDKLNEYMNQRKGYGTALGHIVHYALTIGLVFILQIGLHYYLKKN